MSGLLPEVPVQRLWARILTAEDLGRFLAEIRVERDLTQAELAAELGISRPYLSAVESGRPTLYSERLFTLLNVLQVELTAEAEVPAQLQDDQAAGNDEPRLIQDHEVYLPPSRRAKTTGPQQ